MFLDISSDCRILAKCTHPLLPTSFIRHYLLHNFFFFYFGGHLVIWSPCSHLQSQALTNVDDITAFPHHKATYLFKRRRRRKKHSLTNCCLLFTYCSLSSEFVCNLTFAVPFTCLSQYMAFPMPLQIYLSFISNSSVSAFTQLDVSITRTGLSPCLQLQLFLNLSVSRLPVTPWKHVHFPRERQSHHKGITCGSYSGPWLLLCCVYTVDISAHSKVHDVV